MGAIRHETFWSLYAWLARYSWSYLLVNVRLTTHVFASQGAAVSQIHMSLAETSGVTLSCLTFDS